MNTVPIELYITAELGALLVFTRIRGKDTHTHTTSCINVKIGFVRRGCENGCVHFLNEAIRQQTVVIKAVFAYSCQGHDTESVIGLAAVSMFCMGVLYAMYNLPSTFYIYLDV